MMRRTITQMAFAAFLALGCGSKNSDDSDTPDGGTGPLYGLVSVVFTDDGRTTYVSDSLDVTGVELANAREYADRAEPRVSLPGWSYQFVKLR